MVIEGIGMSMIENGQVGYVPSTPYQGQRFPCKPRGTTMILFVNC